MQAALRELSEEFGPELDVWQTGKVPAAWYGYKLRKATDKGETDAKVGHCGNQAVPPLAPALADIDTRPSHSHRSSSCRPASCEGHQCQTRRKGS